MRRFEELARELARQIELGVFRPGDRLPSVRQLRSERGVSMTTASEALAELERRGLAESRPRSGSYVRASARRLPTPPRPSVDPGLRGVTLPAIADRFVAASAEPGVVPLGGAVVAPELLPSKVLARLARIELRRRDRVFGLYGPPGGDPGLRRALARLAREWGLGVGPEDVVITAGCMDAIRLALLATVEADAVIALESPTFFGFLRLVRDLGHPVVEIPVDPVEGLDLDALEAACARHPIRALILTPTLQNPTGATLSQANRRRLVELAAANGFVVLEDDVYAHLADEAQPPVLAADPRGPVVLCGSLSKVVSPGLRVGYAISPRFAGALARHKLSGTICSPALNQRVLRAFLDEGRLSRHARGLRSRVDRQRAALASAVASAFPDGALTHPAGGFLLWLHLGAGADAMALYHKAIEAGISILPGPLCSASEGCGEFVRLSAGYPFSDAHADAVERLATL